MPKKYEIVQVLNLHCEAGKHDECPGVSFIGRAGKISLVYACVCLCHREEEAVAGELTAVVT